jgi:hypothetical protein
VEIEVQERQLKAGIMQRTDSVVIGAIISSTLFYGCARQLKSDVTPTAIPASVPKSPVPPQKLPTKAEPSVRRNNIKPYGFPDTRTTVVEDLDGYSRLQIGLSQFAGPNSINCGRANLYTKKRTEVDACAVEALKAHKPFRLIYQKGGRHGLNNWGIAGNSKGQVHFLWNYQAGVGTNNYVQDEGFYLCKKPLIVKIKGQSRIACQEKRNLMP